MLLKNACLKFKPLTTRGTFFNEPPRNKSSVGTTLNSIGVVELAEVRAAISSLGLNCNIWNFFLS